MKKDIGYLGFGISGAIQLMILYAIIKIDTNKLLDIVANNQTVILVVLLSIALILSIGVYFLSNKNLNGTNRVSLVLLSCTSFLAISQNLLFLVYGLCDTLLSFVDYPIISLLSIGFFVIFYEVNLALTFGGIIYASDKKWGAIIPLVVAIAGIILIINW